MTLFENQVRRTPLAPAVADEERSLSYRELDGWSTAVCAELVSAGVADGDLVGIRMRGGAEYVAAIIGVLKTGSGYVPLDPDYPSGRLSFIVSDCRPRAVLTGSGGPGIDAGAVETIAMPNYGAYREPSRRPATHADSPAYVIHTSGSTGTPKGVLIRHRNVMGLFRGASRHFTFGPEDTWSLFHSHGFDVSVWEMWGALLHGGRLVCVPEGLRLHPERFARFLVREGVTVLNMVPTAFRHLLGSGEGQHDGLRLRHVVFAGETFDAAPVSRWLARLPADRRPTVVNMYGITEATVHATYRRVAREDLARQGEGTLIGEPMEHLRVRLLDQNLRPVPEGECGEIVLSGAGVSDGYLNRHDLNTSRFVTLPDALGVPEHCFRTGDLAAWSPDGRGLVYHGRLDDQVQYRGFRVELGEIEAVLRASADVRDAVVVLDGAGTTTPKLVAHVVADRRDGTTVQRIHQHLVNSLPRYMVPQRVELVASLPRTASGKTDRRQLLRPLGR
ncbi:amino acid adenylation domain-containing protein [Streptomyces sp. NPDC127098]|uniref:amino acid adenylation domain-containing protein n=1 Tax=Streptomyces sp. NPDC127098 TaxID=3347137 RepID=UPI0036588943